MRYLKMIGKSIDWGDFSKTVLDEAMAAQVSVIIPTYNRSHTLSRAIESVLKQSFDDWELWVVDDGSTDSTPEVLKSYLRNPKIRVVTTPNKGVSAARNIAIERSESPLVSFLDSDDEWIESKLERQVRFFHENPKHSIVHGQEIWIRNGVRVNPMKKHQKSGGDVFKDSLKLCCISPSTVMLCKSIFSKVGLFREDFPVCEDYDLWLKITSQYSVGFIDENLITKYGGHEDQLSRKYKAMDYWRVRAIADLIQRGSLSTDKYKLAAHELLKKSHVLLNGYRKHENLSVYDEIFLLQREQTL